MEGQDNSFYGKSNNDRRADRRDEIWSKVVRAGKRTYFFDVKATRANDYYLTITESKKKVNREGRQFYEKHKLFLYKEDFDKFSGGLMEVIEKIASLRGEQQASQQPETSQNGQPDYETKETTYTTQDEVDSPEVSEPSYQNEGSGASSFTEVNFDDLGSGDQD